MCRCLDLESRWLAGTVGNDAECTAERTSRAEAGTAGGEQLRSRRP